MNIADVRRRAFTMPLTNPSYPPGPYRFSDREYLIIEYETDLDALRAVVPEPLEIVRPIVHYEFIRMPDSTGFGEYAESGRVIPVRFLGEDGVFVHSMYLTARPRLPEAVKSGGSPRNSPSRDSAVRPMSWSAHSTMDRSLERLGQWATSTAKLTPSESLADWLSRITSSKSSLMSTAADLPARTVPPS